MTIIPSDLQMVEGFTDEDGDNYAAFINPSGDSYAIGIKASDGLAWFSIGGWVKPWSDVAEAAKRTLAMMDLDNRNYASGATKMEEA
jgi:hypothetical protein